MTRAAIDARGLAHAYRRLVLWFGVQLLLTVALAAARAAGGSVAEPVLWFVLAAGLATRVAGVYYGYRTAQALGSGVAWLWAVATFVRYIEGIALVALSLKATRACRANGIAVGILGPKV